jgi:2-polyprenyl-3-methyl-5-hydroxy-6-metoxy-1,4-benzoquinol methylase
MWYKAFLKHIFPNLPIADMNVLEVGAGFGWLLEKLSATGSQCFGTEIVAEPFHTLSPSLRSRLILADGKQLPFPDKSFDLVVCMEVIEHVLNPRLVLDELARVSRQYVVLSCPNYLNLYFFIRVAAALGLPSASRYINRQQIDRFTTSVHLRRLVTQSPSLRLIGQRAVRLAPPFFEKLEATKLQRVNDAIFWLEENCAHHAPLNFMGLHTICVARKES